MSGPVLILSVTLGLIVLLRPCRWQAKGGQRARPRLRRKVPCFGAEQVKVPLDVLDISN